MDHARDRPTDGLPSGRHRVRWASCAGLEAIEVALIAGLMMVIVAVMVPLMTGGISAAMNAVSDAITTAGAGIN